MRSNIPEIDRAIRVQGDVVYLATPASVGVYSAWTQLIAATTGPVGFLNMEIVITAGVNATSQIQLATGAGGAEIAIPGFDFTISNPNAAVIAPHLYMPINRGLILMGARVSFRVRNTTSGSSVGHYVGVYLGELF